MQRTSASERPPVTNGGRLFDEDPNDVSDPRSKFRVIYDTWFEDVARWIRALGGLDADRDDIAQEVFLVVRRRLSSFDGVNPAGWLYRITRRQVRDFRRRTWVKHIFNKRRSDQPDILPHEGGGPAAALEHKEKQRVLHTLLQKMSEDHRGALVLFEIEGLSGEEIARIQSVPVNTVWTRLHHARKEFFALATKYRRINGQPQREAQGSVAEDESGEAAELSAPSGSSRQAAMSQQHSDEPDDTTSSSSTDKTYKPSNSGNSDKSDEIDKTNKIEKSDKRAKRGRVRQ